MGIVAFWVGWIGPEWEYLSARKPYSIQKVPDPKVSGEETLRFELRKGDSWLSRGGSSHRAEIETRERPQMNSVRWYRFSLMLPQDFPIEDNRLVLAQWHGVDKNYLGEPARSPVLAFRYSSGEFSITMRHSAERIVRDADAVPSKKLFVTKSFPLNEWNDFVVQAKWAYTEDGFINVWWNGKQIVEYHGPVGYNDDLAPYFQFGIYRDETDKTYVSYMKRIRMGRTAQDVGFK
jgi:hypothetical protein